MTQRRRRANPAAFLTYAVLIVWTVIVYFPIYWTLITSFKLPIDVSGGATYLPFVDFTPSLHAWQGIFSGDDRAVFRHFANGTIISLVSSAVAVLVAAMAGYGLARFPYRFGSWRNSDIAFWFISQRIMPPVAVVLAFLIMYQAVGLIDSRVGMIIAYTSFGLPLAIWILRDYFADLPPELEDAARIDGAGRFQAFFRIALPLAMPGVVATFILCFIFAWNEYLFALILTFQRAGTVPILLASQVTGTGVQWWRMAALAIMSIVPSVAAAVFLERRIASGLFVGGIK